MATRKRQPAALKLPERFTVECAAELLADMQGRVAKGGKVTIDLTDVVTVDTAGLQLLAVVRHQLIADGRECEIRSVPDSVAEGARLLGVHQHLGLA